MKRVLIFTILLLSTTIAFSQSLKDNANNRYETTGTRAQGYDAVITDMENTLHDNQNGREWHRISTKLNTLEVDLLFLRRSFNAAQTPAERERILNSYKEKKSEYDSTRDELQKFIGTLK
jgi:hypothetical protein